MALIAGFLGGMADLLIRGVDKGIVQALKKRAGDHGVSQEAELRAILAAALLSPPRRNLADVLSAMPNVGLDTNFERLIEPDRADNVFG
jgi:plasmid stability protein